MKRMFKILVVMLAIVSATSAEAQTKEFLTQFNEVKRLVELPNSTHYKNIEIAQYPAEILRAMGTNVSVNGRNILNNIKVIYQVKIPLDSSYGRATYNWFIGLTTGKQKAYEAIMSQSGQDKDISIYKATKTKSSQPEDYLIMYRNKTKAMVCDIVGYIKLEDVINMLSPELKDTLGLPNK